MMQLAQLLVELNHRNKALLMCKPYFVEVGLRGGFYTFQAGSTSATYFDLGLGGRSWDTQSVVMCISLIQRSSKKCFPSCPKNP